MKITSRSLVYQGFYKIEKVTLEHRGETLTRELFRNKDAVAALVFNTVKGQYIFTKQYRVSAEKPMLEIPAGLLDKEGEKPEETIKREILEETGYETDTLTFISSFYSSPGGCAEKIFLYYAEVSRQKAAGGGLASESEHIEIISLSENQLAQNTFEDGKTLLALEWLKNRRRQPA